MKKTIEDIKKQMLMTRDKSGLAMISMIETFVKKEKATIGQAITYFLKDKTITGYKKNILNLLRITYPYDGEIAQVKNNKSDFISSFDILKEKAESIPDIKTSEVETSLDNRQTHPEDYHDNGMGNSSTAVYSVYQTTQSPISDKPQKGRKVVRHDKKTQENFENDVEK